MPGRTGGTGDGGGIQPSEPGEPRDEKIIPTFKRLYHIRDGRTYEEAGEGREFG